MQSGIIAHIRDQIKSFKEEMFSDKAIPLSSSPSADNLYLPTLVTQFGGISFFPGCPYSTRVDSHNFPLSVCDSWVHWCLHILVLHKIILLFYLFT